MNGKYHLQELIDTVKPHGFIVGKCDCCEECIRKKEGPPYFYKNGVKLGWMLEDIVHLNNVGAIRITRDNELIQLLYKSYNKTHT